MLDKPAAFRRPHRLASRLASRLALRLGLLAGLSAASAASLTADAADAAETPRYYQVEVVVFAQPAGGSVELPPRAEEPPESPETSESADSAGSPAALLSRILPGAPDDAGALQDEAPSLPEGFQPPREPLRLAAVAARLDTGGYDLLWHQGWVQPPTSRQGIDLPLLAALGQGPADQRLGGSIGLTSARFLHLGMQLELRSGDLLEAEMAQRRRIRRGVEQYYDHPRIGVVAVVTEIESDAAQPTSEP
ncbi:CsiV family protein [Wenzhouxiangella sp. XN24]|uniref:CsiV family protein n=1 Tax=Wenzhouxiangella sp. XN24 TaxID=2713569 RepID=UPI0013EC42A0|nr:CsiV family protein [Wenzhouxiangella sp. XN24]NGX16732.1 hypothetical protein [Wenzhouxiangella sp. XN24]